MDKQDDFFEIEKGFSKFNKYLAAMVAIYYLLLLVFEKYGSMNDILFGFSVVVSLALDWLIGYKYYFNKKIVFRIVRYFILFSTGLAMIHCSGIYITVVSMSVIHIAIVFQHLFLFDIVEDYYKINAVIESLFPIGLIALLYYFFIATSNFEVFISLMFCSIFTLTLVANMKIIGNLINKLYNDMYRNERIAINSKEEYENLKIYQSKLVRANEQLSIQRFQLQKLNESVNSKNKQMDIQYNILRHISSALEIEKLTEYITSSIISNLKVEICGIYVFDTDVEEGEQPKSFYNVNYSSEMRLPDNSIELFREYINKNNIRDMQDEYMIVNDVNDEEYPFIAGMGIVTYLVYLIKISDTQKGFIFVGKNTNNYFSESNIGFYRGIAEQISVAVNNASLYSKMQDMATKDTLTKIFNRRHFNSFYPKIIEECKQNKEMLTVILVDIDKFKTINDRYGHLFGDKVIHYCGSTVGKTAIENNGMPIRYGGEEFVIIFPQKGVDEVYEIVKKMHEQIKAYEFDYEGESVHFNVSIGIASYPETCEDLGELINRADLAMYYSKNTGRGRITVDNPKFRGE